MIKVKSVSCGHFPFGSAQGAPVFYVVFDTDKEVPADKEAIEKNFKECMDIIKKYIDDNHFEQEWISVLTGGKYLIVSGEELMMPGNRECFEAFFNGVSHLAHDAQNDIQVEFKKRPPMFGFIGSPLHNTGREQWYEHFNLIGIMVDSKVENKEPFALLEMMHNSFACVTCECSTPEEVDNLMNNYIKDTYFPTLRTIVITDDEKTRQRALKYDLKVNSALKGSTVIKV